MSIEKIVVSGGGGFVGFALCRYFRERGHQVVSLARGNYPQLEEIGVRALRCDLSQSLEPLNSELQGASVFFHTAAKVDMWGRYEEFFQANVVATQNVIAACRQNKIANLIFTSSPSVVADGSNLRGVDESCSYPAHYEAFYPQTKAIAEREVIAAHGQGLRTLALRPHLIFGPGDTNLVPTILTKARAGRLVQVGAGTNQTDLCFIQDCVRAHVCAWQALQQKVNAGGQAYFITQGEPVNMWAWINQVLALNSLPAIKRRIPTSIAYGIASVAENLAKILPGLPEPFLTKFLVSEMATDHWFNISKADYLLGFKPEFSISQAMSLTFRGL